MAFLEARQSGRFTRTASCRLEDTRQTTAEQSRFGTERTGLSHVSRYVLPEVCWQKMKRCLIQIIALGRLNLLRAMAWARIPAEQ